MRDRTPTHPVIGLILVTLALAGCSEKPGPDGANAPLAPGAAIPSAARIAPEFDSATFVSGVTNPFFPLTPGAVYTYHAETSEGTETTVDEVLSETKTVAGVEATVVHDQVYVDDALVEDTFDWYAQDEEGNVWYLGEDTKEYEDGVVVSTEGSWEAGVNGAEAGIVMLAHPKKGTAYAQENAPDVAEDQARVTSLNESVTVPYGTFDGVLQTVEWTPLEHGVREYKYYAEGVGLVLETSKRGGGERTELLSVGGL